MDVFYGRKYKCEIYSLQIENRGDDLDCTKENVIRDNMYNLEMCRKHDCNYILMKENYHVDTE